MIKRVLITLLSIATTLGALEGLVRVGHARTAEAPIAPGPEVLELMARSTVSGRERENQFLIHNTALFQTHPAPQTVTTGYIGTSRTKPLRPEAYGQHGAVNAAGNSYNEISYGIVLQAALLRRRFPHLKRLYVESSLLMRRPPAPHFVLEADHRRYLPLLAELAGLRDQLPDGPAFRAFLAGGASAHASRWKPLLYTERGHLLLSSLLFPDPATRPIPVRQEPLLAALSPNGEHREALKLSTAPADQPAPIARDHAKVQRLREIPSWAPWDYGFEMMALWGQREHVQIVFFQPPVRSDLRAFQLQMGLEAHVKDMQRVARRYGTPFIDLDTEEAGYTRDWSLFSDEDHMGTRRGVGHLLSALELGYRAWTERRELLPRVTMDATLAELRRQGHAE